MLIRIHRITETRVTIGLHMLKFERQHGEGIYDYIEELIKNIKGDETVGTRTIANQ